MVGKTARVLGVAAISGVGMAAVLTPVATAATADTSTKAVSEGQGPRWAEGTVNAEGGLNGRIAPSLHAQENYTFDDGLKVSLNCMTKGTEIEGDAEWYLVAAEGDAKWVSARYVDLDGDQPEYCGAKVSSSVTVAEDTDSYQGPSTSDETRRTFQAGDGQEAVCYVNTGPGATDQWVATLEDGWVPAANLTSIDDVPFCSQ